MFLPVAIDAESDAIRYFKSEVWMIGKPFYVMSVKMTIMTTSLTFKIISLVNAQSPHLKLVSRSGAFTFKRSSIFPVRGFIANHIGGRAFDGAKLSTTLGIAFKRLPANRAMNRLNAIAPAFLRAIARRFSAVLMLNVFLPAYFAYQRNTFSARVNRDSLSGHKHIIAYIGAGYCDVKMTAIYRIKSYSKS